MNTELFAELAAKAQGGDHRALIQLLRLAHTPVCFLCRNLLRSEQAAQALTLEILQGIPRQLPLLKDPAEFETWICRITAGRCMRALANMRQDAPDDATQPVNPPRIPAKHLDEAQTVQVVQQLVDDLPDAPRICLILYSCAGLKLKGIAQLTGYPEATVLDHLNLAQKSINNQLRKYHRMGVRFAPIPALSTLLRTSMYSSQDPKAAAAMVAGFLEKKPAPPVRKRRFSAPMLIALIAAAVLLVGMVAAIFVLEGKRQAPPEGPAAPMAETTLSAQAYDLPSTSVS